MIKRVSSVPDSEQEDESSGTDVEEINTNQLSEAGEKRRGKERAATEGRCAVGN